MREIERKDKDEIAEVKQVRQEVQTIFDSRIYPHENHTLFEVDLKALTIVEASFEELAAIKWEDAVKGLISANRKVIKKQNCIYISALNKENVKKILKRDHNITV